MKHVVALAGMLAAVWLLWSGHYTFEHGLVAAFGVASVALVVWLSARMRIVDEEGQPIHLAFRLLGYVPWLLKEILTANLQVARLILHPKRPISPVVVTITAHQKTDLGRVLFANSITLTPGTYTILAEGGKLTVHAVAREMTVVERGPMDLRVSRVEGDR